MNVEILVTGEVVEHEGEDFKDMEMDILRAIRDAIKNFAGSKLKSTPYHENGVFGVLENVDHEVSFGYEGTYEYVKAEEKDHA